MAGNTVRLHRVLRALLARLVEAGIPG